MDVSRARQRGAWELIGFSPRDRSREVGRWRRWAGQRWGRRDSNRTIHVTLCGGPTPAYAPGKTARSVLAWWWLRHGRRRQRKSARHRVTAERKHDGCIHYSPHGMEVSHQLHTCRYKRNWSITAGKVLASHATKKQRDNVHMSAAHTCERTIKNKSISTVVQTNTRHRPRGNFYSTPSGEKKRGTHMNMHTHTHTHVGM